MTAFSSSTPISARVAAPAVAAVLSFVVLFWEPIWTLGLDWWANPDAGHGLLLGPLAVFLAYKKGRAPGAKPQPVLGIVLLCGAVLLRYLAGLAAEMLTLRMSMLGAGGALVVFLAGWRQLLHWWLPATLLMLSVPIPAVILNSLAFPLQLKASQLGASLLEWRNVPVMLTGNVIHLPERSLFVTEACSGLRSLTALISLGVLIGGLSLTLPVVRLFLVALAVPVAMVLNGFRVFLTGFLVYFVDPELGDGFMHYTEGWVVFVIALAILGCVAWLLSVGEAAWHRRSED